MKRVIIVDTKLVAYTLHHKHISLTEYLNYVYSYIKHYPYTKIVWAFDAEGGSTHRKQIYPQYKGQRKTARKKLNHKEQSRLNTMLHIYNNKLYSMLKLVGSPVKLDGVEADDLAAIVCEIYNGSDVEVLLVSSDADWGSLISNNIKQLHLSRNRIIDINNYTKEYELFNPKAYMDYQYIAGLNKENVSGVHKLGKGRFIKIYNECNGDIDCIIDIAQQYVDNGKYGMSIPHTVKTVQELYNRNKAILSHIKIENLSEDTFQSFKEQFNHIYKTVTDVDILETGVSVFGDYPVLSPEMLEYYKIKEI